METNKENLETSKAMLRDQLKKEFQTTVDQLNSEAKEILRSFLIWN